MHVVVEAKSDSCFVIIIYAYEKEHLPNIIILHRPRDIRKWTNILKNRGIEKFWNLCETQVVMAEFQIKGGN